MPDKRSCEIVQVQLSVFMINQVVSGSHDNLHFRIKWLLIHKVSDQTIFGKCQAVSTRYNFTMPISIETSALDLRGH